jgi:hypothetical protein
MKEVKSGVYLHYSGLIVLVIGLARHSETEEKFVTYIPLGVKAGPRLTVRPMEMFFEKVEHEGKAVPRFKYWPRNAGRSSQIIQSAIKIAFNAQT